MVDELTDEQLVEAVATKVMGWHLVEGGDTWSEIPGHTRQDKFWVFVKDWNPLTSDADCGQVLDRIVSMLDFCIRYDYKKRRWMVAYWNGQAGEKKNWTYGKDRRRAIVIAALRAVGVEV